MENICLQDMERWITLHVWLSESDEKIEYAVQSHK